MTGPRVDLPEQEPVPATEPAAAEFLADELVTVANTPTIALHSERDSKVQPTSARLPGAGRRGGP